MQHSKIVKRQKPELVNGKVKRTGEAYYEVRFWNGFNWDFRTFGDIKEAKTFVSK